MKHTKFLNLFAENCIEYCIALIVREVYTMLIILYGLAAMGIVTIGLLVHMFNRLPQ